MRYTNKTEAIKNANKALNKRNTTINEGWVSAGGDGDERQEAFISIYNQMVGDYEDRFYGELTLRDRMLSVVEVARKTDITDGMIADILMYVLKKSNIKTF